ncbi:MAG TPA: biotin/lipoyl-binding protein, partial [Bryobacteraceae bacterium]|nr:biotin/lipoyl-binding protein [Bryobacteraceae bacterium]
MSSLAVTRTVFCMAKARRAGDVRVRSNQNSLLAIMTAALLCAGGCKQQKVQTVSGPPPVPVSIATVAEESVPNELTAVGNVEASSVVEIKAQVGGQLDRVHFTEGQTVQAGAVLFELDSRPYREALRQAVAAVARDR